MKKGLTLIEIVISLGLLGVFLTLVSLGFSTSRDNFKLKILNNRSKYTSEEALNFIQYKLDQNWQNIIVYENSLVFLDYSNNTQKVRQNGSKIILEYKEGNYTLTSNNVLTDVKKFNVVQEKRIIYIKIEPIEGKVIERCFPLKSL